MEIEKSKFNTRKLVISALSIALYVLVMIITQSFAFGAVQIRIATCMYALAYIYPFLVLPLGIANIISNMVLGGLGFFDIFGGGLVGILTSFAVCFVRKYKMNISLIIVPIIFIPGLVVPIWLSYLLGVPYKILATSLCLGQVMPAILGLLLTFKLKNKIGDIN